VNTIPSAERPISAYVLVENRLVREALVRLLRKRAFMTVTGASGDGQVALEQLTAAPCDVLLIDSLEILRTFQTYSGTSNRDGTIRVLLLGMEQDPEHFLHAVGLGVCGYLLKDVSTSELIEAVRATARGEAVCPPELCKTLFDLVATGMVSRSESSEQTGYRQSSLTFRQRQLMTLVAEGLTNKEIASSLNLSEFTVKNHIHRVMAHLHADSRHKAVEAIRAGAYTLQRESDNA
jgi:DNA-binding NarL/FixJ family response regulator